MCSKRVPIRQSCVRNPTRVAVRFADEDLWLTQSQLAEIYDTTKQNISLHIENILKDGE